jgi:PAS domain S-box-containing protein
MPHMTVHINTNERAPSRRFLPDRVGLVRSALIALAVALGSGLVFHRIVRRFLVSEAEERVETTLRTNRALHRYLQEVLHPEFYRAQEAGQIAPDYYSPQLFSSSFIVRRTQALENEERERAGLPRIYYKMAAENPRNPVNRADARELELLRAFNDDRSKKTHRAVVTTDGQEYLEVALPFLETTEACTRCHGDREHAPVGVTARYPSEAGFGEPVGRIRAIESIRAPIAGTVRIAWAASGALALGALSFAGLAFVSGALRRRVRERTASLVTEISERQRAQEEVVHLKDELSGIVDASPAAVAALDDEWRVTLWNRQARAMSGLGPDAAVGLHVSDLLPSLAPELAALRAGPAGPGGVRVRSRVKVGHAGALRVYDLLHYPFLVGGVGGGVLRVDDVTDRARLEAHVEQAQRIDAIGTLAGGIAHDFNNILSAIAGHASAALREPLDPQVREDLEAISAASRRATALTRQILSFSRQGAQEPRPVQPAAIAREALKLLRATIPSTIEIRSRLDSRATLVADPGDLHRVIVNLCTNAALAMKDGGVLEVCCDREEADPAHRGASLKLAVRDTGVGMTPQVQAHIFEPFFTTRHDDGGTGLGLATVNKIVERLGGSIAVMSSPGKGTTFEVRLPIADVTAEEWRPAEPVDLPGTERILFVDDEEAVCRVAERHLSRLGYRVKTFTSAPEALTAFLAASEEWDLVVTDMTMPSLTGDEVARRVKELRPTLPVVLCTGYSEKVCAERARALGIDRFVLKPVVGADLVHVIRSVLDGSRLRA